VRDIEEIWNSGESTPCGLTGDALQKFKDMTASSEVTGIKWRHSGIEHTLHGLAHVLPDLSGVTLIQKERDFRKMALGSNFMDVFNADGTLRFRLTPPAIGDRYDPAFARLESVGNGWPASGIDLGVFAAYPLVSSSVGRRQYLGFLLDIDWSNGALRKSAVLPPGW
jgi:hypothetical protein